MRILVKELGEIENPYKPRSNNPSSMMIGRKEGFNTGKQAILNASVEVDIDEMARILKDYKRHVGYALLGGMRSMPFSRFLTEELKANSKTLDKS